MPVVRKIAVNPADKTKRYALYSNGFIQPIGGALPVPMGDASLNSPPSPSAPLWQASEPAMSFQVLNWATPSGYTLDMWGHIWPWGGIAGVAGAVQPLTGGPEYLFGTGGGFSSPIYGFVIDFIMDPGGSGTGYFLQYNGDVIGVGTGVPAVFHTTVIPDTAARQLQMDWASKRYWVLDNMGRITGYNGGNSPAVVDVNGVSATYPAWIWGRGGQLGQGGFRLYDKSATPKGWVVDAFGRVYRVGAAQDAPGFPMSAIREWVDLEIIDDGTGVNPLRLLVVGAQARQFEYVVSTAPVAVVTEPSGTLTTANKPWVGWQYIDREGDGQASYEVRIANSTAYLAGTTNEVQSLNQTGAPTGGSVRLGFQRSATAPISATTTIANNAAAATIQAALEALPNIGTGGVVCAGGPWGTAPVTVTFQGQMAGWDWPPMTIYSNNFTGGVTPTIAISTTTPGVGANPAAISNVWSKLGTDLVTRVRDEVDLPNTTTYRAFVRVTDTSVKTSSWDFKQFATNFTPLSLPTVVASNVGGAQGVSLSVTAATGVGLPGTARFAVQYQDMGSATWYNVRNGDALVPNGSGQASVLDFEAPFGMVRTYRAVTYINDSASDSWQQSPWSASVNNTLLPQNIWVLQNPFNTTQATVVRVQEFEPVARTLSTTFTAVNRDDPIVLSDGKPKLPAIELKLWALSTTERNRIEALVNSAQVLCLRNPFGECFYIKVEGEFKKKLLRASPLKTETTSLRDARDISVQFQSVKRPQAGPLTGPLAEV